MITKGVETRWYAVKKEVHKRAKERQRKLREEKLKRILNEKYTT